ncbi:MAG TPA: hypothetical protein VK737_00025, partial [Opitutales bacterium]|nr:hypothetical protein [Opitutales bacterium]
MKTNFLFCLLAAMTAASPARAQNTPAVGSNNPTDLERMIAILNIPTPPPPRPAGVAETHDEAKVAPYTLPDPLKLKNGQMVTTAEMWWKQRRPEIYEDSMREIYGKIPANTPKITWEVVSTTDNGRIKTKNVLGHIDNSSYPAATPTIQLIVNTPSNAPGRVPMIVELSAPGFGFPAGPVADPGPNTQEMAAISSALKKLIEANDPSTTDIFEKHPTYAMLGSGAPPTGQNAAGAAGPAANSPEAQILALGWGYALYNTGSVQADSNAGLTQGIIGLMNKGQPRSRPDEWGVLAAWAWGLSKSVDYFETDKDVDAKQLALQGFSRWGKTAVLAAAIEPRWALAWAGDSGEGGTKINRRDYGETVDDVAKNFYWWMAGNF